VPDRGQCFVVGEHHELEPERAEDRAYTGPAEGLLPIASVKRCGAFATNPPARLIMVHLQRKNEGAT
jgi:hypothetical protein